MHHSPANSLGHDSQCGRDIERGAIQCLEVAAGSIAVIPSSHVAPPRIATSPVSFECRTFQVIRPGPQQTIILAEVIAAHVKDTFILDPIRVHLDTPGMQLIGRMQSPGWYARCNDLIQIRPPRPWTGQEGS